MASCLPWCIDKRRVDGVAVTRHAVFVVASLAVGTVDHDGKLNSPPVVAVLRREIMLDLTTPSFRELLLDLGAPLNDWHHVGVVVCLHQRETFPIVEFAVDVDSFHLEVKVVDKSEELGEDVAGGVAVVNEYENFCELSSIEE